MSTHRPHRFPLAVGGTEPYRCSGCLTCNGVGHPGLPIRQWTKGVTSPAVAESDAIIIQWVSCPSAGSTQQEGSGEADRHGRDGSMEGLATNGYCGGSR